jgi:hypothetical protein
MDKEREPPIQFFLVFFCWVLISGCASSPEPGTTGVDVLPFEPGVYLSQVTEEELHLSEPVNMSGICSIAGTDKTGTYILDRSAYTDSYIITFSWSDGSTTSAFVVNGNRKALRFGTDTLWLWKYYE